MILKQKWPTKDQKNKEIAYNPKRKNKYIITDRYMNTGKPYIQAKFEAEIAPLITIGRAKFEIIPRDGDMTNIAQDNILLSGPLKKKGIQRENAVKNEILRLEYDPEDKTFSYIFKENGVNQELRYKNFEALRARVAQSRFLHGLKNKKYLLTVNEYLHLYDDYIQGKTPQDDTDFDICSYKSEEIQEKFNKKTQ